MNLPSCMKIIRAALQVFPLCFVPVGLLFGLDIATVGRAGAPASNTEKNISPRGRLGLTRLLWARPLAYREYSGDV